LSIDPAERHPLPVAVSQCHSLPVLDINGIKATSGNASVQVIQKEMEQPCAGFDPAAAIPIVAAPLFGFLAKHQRPRNQKPASIKNTGLRRGG
jgi:hypothetical protein